MNTSSDATARIVAPLDWQFPLPRPYTGILLGNGNMGLMVWGENDLRITIGCNGFWDRRGGVPFAAQTNYHTLRHLLETGDKAALKAAFSNPRKRLPYCTPTQLPGGRLDLHPGAPPVRARLEVTTGWLEVELADGRQLRIRQSMHRNLARIQGATGSVRLLPAWHWIGEVLTAGGAAPPQQWDEADGGGFVQTLPEDPALAVAWRRCGEEVTIATAIGPAPREDVERLLAADDVAQDTAETDAWWAAYYHDVPRVSLPDAALQRAWDYGIFKQAGMTPPHAVPATLQGPWMAENELPPWSNDYHFNINLQMIYWPAFPTNRTAHLLPVWKMLLGWLPALRENATGFFQCPAALMLPHAVDDRCQVIGNFWQGTIDQACTAWMAQLAWLHYRHTMDVAILRDIAWPLLVGAFEGFWAMREECDGRLALPVSVSAEFPGWGRNASFQLAAFHLLARILPDAARILGEPADPRWERVQRELPLFTVITSANDQPGPEPRTRIALWEGQDLTESHRHHSHLAAIAPFAILDPLDATCRDLIRRTIDHWAVMGPGQWTGWSMPWAAMIWARCNCASASVTLLRIWEDVFTNLGGQTLHNADSPGYSAWIHGPLLDPPESRRTNDQMQMDAGFGVLQALAEIFVQQRGTRLHVLPSLPKQWRDFAFDGILCEGAFLTGATVVGRTVREVRITSRCGGPLHLVLPGRFRHADRVATAFELETAPGQQMVFVAEQTS